MPYRLYIEKRKHDEIDRKESISLDDWKRAVSGIEGLRLPAPRMVTGCNPKTGAEVTILTGDGNVEVYFPTEQCWHLVFRWSRGGSARFTVNFTPGDSSHPAWAAAVALATSLGAVICGEKKEIYDLKTGKYVAMRSELGPIDYSTNLREYRIRFEPVPEGEQACTLPAGEHLGLRSKLGGEPDWDQGDETPACKSCGEPMSFVGQLDSMENMGPHKQARYDQDFMFGDVGMIYIFFCFDCLETQSIFQCG